MEHTIVTTIEDRQVDVGMEQLMAYHDYELTQRLCAQCPNYGKTWACPPFDFDVDELLSPFKRARVFATIVTLDDDARHRCTTADEASALMLAALRQAYDHIAPTLLEMERNTPGSLALLSISSCPHCDTCPRSTSACDHCLHPELMRHSLESVGFLLSDISRDLLNHPLTWSTGTLPPSTTTLLTALLMK